MSRLVTWIAEASLWCISHKSNHWDVLIATLTDWSYRLPLVISSGSSWEPYQSLRSVTHSLIACLTLHIIVSAKDRCVMWFSVSMISMLWPCTACCQMLITAAAVHCGDHAILLHVLQMVQIAVLEMVQCSLMCTSPMHVTCLSADCCNVM